jgi:predicted metal-binding membrane protein
MTTNANSAPAANGAPSLPSRDRAVIWIGLIALSALAWIYLARMPMSANDFSPIVARILAAMPAGMADASITFLMWAVMMVAMMLPSAGPTISTFAAIARPRPGFSAAHVWMMVGGYIAAWTAFSAAATLLQIALQRAAMLSGAAAATPLAGAAILAAAGLYQFTPFKEACLSGCQSPIGFFMTHWRDGAIGAFRMGARHGWVCIGCCAMLMALLFVAGVMNLTWVALISVLVLLEKATPWGRTIARVAGVAMIAAAPIVALAH